MYPVLRMSVRKSLYITIILPECGVERVMADNLKVKASKAIDDVKVAAHAVYDDASVAAHNIAKGGEKEAQKGSDDVKIGVHKAVSDAKIAAHEAVSKLKKK